MIKRSFWTRMKQFNASYSKNFARRLNFFSQGSKRMIFFQKKYLSQTFSCRHKKGSFVNPADILPPKGKYSPQIVRPETRYAILTVLSKKICQFSKNFISTSEIDQRKIVFSQNVPSDAYTAVLIRLRKKY